MSSAPQPKADGFVILLDMFAESISSMSAPNPQPPARIPMPAVDNPNFRASIARLEELLAGSEVTNAGSLIPSCKELTDRVGWLHYNDSWVERMTAAGFAPAIWRFMEKCGEDPACARAWDVISNKMCCDYGVPRDLWNQAWKELAERGAPKQVAP